MNARSCPANWIGLILPRISHLRSGARESRVRIHDREQHSAGWPSARGHGLDSGRRVLDGQRRKIQRRTMLLTDYGR